MTALQPFLFGETWVEVKDGNDTVRAIFDQHYSRYLYADGRKPLGGRMKHDRDIATEHPGCVPPGPRPRHVMKAMARFWSAYDRWCAHPTDINEIRMDDLYCRYAEIEARWRMEQ